MSIFARIAAATGVVIFALCILSLNLGEGDGPGEPVATPVPVQHQPAELRVRKEIRSLTADEKAKLIRALLAIKKSGVYDRFVHLHRHAFCHPTPGENEIANPKYRNAAHRGPAFLPWHRAFILQFENELRKVEPTVTLPYWDWTIDQELPDPSQSPLWQPDFLGGNGTRDNNWKVMTGPFAADTGNWPLTVNVNTKGEPMPQFLQRGFGQFDDPTGVRIETLPTKADVEACLNEQFFDAFPWTNRNFAGGLSSRLEGWVMQHVDPRVKHPGMQNHARVHIWVGGTMVLPTSPNDPAFFLHHAFVDKIWADWEVRFRSTNKALKPGEILYVPRQGGPEGHNLYDRMFLTDPPTRPIDMLDHHALGYRYEGEPTNPHHENHVH